MADTRDAAVLGPEAARAVEAAISSRGSARAFRIIRERLLSSEQDAVACGMALGHADGTAPETRLRAGRAPAAEFAGVSGF